MKLLIIPAIVLLLAARAAMPQPSPASGAATKPNIIFILTDDLGYGDVNCYGADTNILQTPRIDQLAAEGIRFTDGHAPASTCTPSRYSFLTGEYAWRTPGTGIASGVAPLLIHEGSVTVPSLLRAAGYATAVVGKWHLGLGSGNTDYNNPPVKPGPLEIGFDYYFGPPATGDRVPCVFMENHSIYNYDPADPLLISYSSMVGNLPTGTSHPQLLKYYDGGTSHSRTIINGIGRIGWMDGVTNAWWRDEDFADVFVARAGAFIEQHTNSPFFLYLSTHDIHVPRAPHERFQGTSGHAWRGDAIHSMDWTVGAILDKLESLNLSTNTLVIFTSDNGSVMDDGYDDDYADGISTDDYGPHNSAAANGPFSGGKYSLREGGTRVPFIVRWPGVAPSNTVSSALISATDLLATFAALTGQPLPTDAGPDSENVLPALLGQSATARTVFVGQNNRSTPRSLRQGDWKYHGNNGNLYDLSTDFEEASDVSGSNPAKAAEMAALLDDIAAVPMKSSLLAWWPLNEGEGDQALDRSLKGYTGALVNTPAWTTHSNLTFLRFNGSDESVAVDGLPAVTGGLTVACWARSATANWNASGCLVSRRPQFVLSPVQGTGRIEAMFYNATGAVQTLAFDPTPLPGFNLTDWHHYAATYDAATGETRLFVDGTARTNTTLAAGTLGPATGTLTLGCDGGSPGTFLAGDLADVRVYDQVLTAQRVANTASAILLDADADTMLDDWEMRFGLDPFNAADALLDTDSDGVTNVVEFNLNTSPLLHNSGSTGGLLGYWPLDETNGVTATDVSGHEHHGTLVDAPVWSSGAGRSYLQFDGVSQHVVVNGLPNLNAHVTVACWARSDTSTWNVAGCLMSRRPQWLLHPWLNPAADKRLSFMVFDAGGASRTANINLATLPGFSLTDWHHYTGTYDSIAGQIKVYVDGMLADTTTLGSTLLEDYTGPLGFGRDYTGSSRYFDGALDELRLYDRVLDANEVLALTAGFDDDQDGMADEAERQIINFNPWDGINTLADVLPQDDFDNDGASNGDEAVAGTDATAAADLFRIMSYDASSSEAPFTVFMAARAGRSYSLERALTLGGAWEVVDESGPIQSNLTIELVEGQVDHPAAFYRLTVGITP